jgi:two-component system, NarL family, response regulator
MSLKILLIEDDELFRLGLRVRLQQEPDLEVVAEAEDGETAIELSNQHSLDVVLLDVGLPGIGGIETCRQMKQCHPQLPILALTSHSQSALIARLVEAGAQGYCLKGIVAETLILALRSVVAGASWWDATATQTIRTALESTSTLTNPADSPKTENALTQREQEILALIAAGKSNPDIATTLYITPGTVRVHVHSILHKLGVRDRTQAVIVALKQQFIAESNKSL